ncbi:hypothetical protein PMAYCL1PPCAC_25827, partial [Pristionchus mayeri]
VQGVGRAYVRSPAHPAPLLLDLHDLLRSRGLLALVPTSSSDPLQPLDPADCNDLLSGVRSQSSKASACRRHPRPSDNLVHVLALPPLVDLWHIL